MILETLPDIPRWYTGVAEWCGALVYVLVVLPRLRGGGRVALIVAALPAMIGLQIFVGTWPLSLWMIGMAVAVGAILVFIRLATAGTWRDAWYLTARAFVLAELVASLEWQLWVHWVSRQSLPPPAPGEFWPGIGLLVLSYGAGFYVAWRLERRNLQRTPLDVDGRPLVTAMAIALGTFLVSNLSFLTTETPFSGQQAVDIFYIRTLVDLAGFVALYAQQSNRNHVRDVLQLSQSRLLMQAQHEQYLESQRNATELHRMHHDLKHLATAMRAEDSAARRSEYLRELEHVIEDYQSDIRTGSPLLDTVLSSKGRHCLQTGITMTVIVDGEALGFMGAISLSALFGNAIDNAIEASLHLEDPEHRIIKVSAFTQGDFVVIRVENHFPFPVEFIDGLPQTTKEDQVWHGYGTGNMRRVVESLNGSITFTVEDDWFIVRALIPRPVD